MVVMEADGKKTMRTATTTGVLDYGSATDVWQVFIYYYYYFIFIINLK